MIEVGSLELCQRVDDLCLSDAQLFNSLTGSLAGDDNALGGYAAPQASKECSDLGLSRLHTDIMHTNSVRGKGGAPQPQPASQPSCSASVRRPALSRRLCCEFAAPIGVGQRGSSLDGVARLVAEPRVSGAHA